jgi:4-hydroxythreonine-4-phosphate dehydrogenase
MKKLTVAITIGDPSGIGPEIALKALTRRYLRRVSFLLVGDSFVLKETAKRFDHRQPINKTSAFSLIDLKNVDKETFKFGRVNAMCGKAAVEYIKKAVDLIKLEKADALVTAPINKEAAALSGFKWPGHTEYLANLTGSRRFCMMLAGGPLRVVLATRHIALHEVPTRLNPREIYGAIDITQDSLKRHFGIKRPRIAVCSLNPHAGEGGLFSDEESRIIAPAIKKARLNIPNIEIAGPLPSDSLFYDAYRGRFDAEIVMYHDQGLIPLKMIAKDTGVNITLGLPFVRTSPAHGTAFDIAGKNKANPSSMIEAIKMAIDLS